MFKFGLACHKYVELMFAFISLPHKGNENAKEIETMMSSSNY